MDCNKTDCIHYKVCEEWKSLGNDNYINESNGNCDCYSSPYNPTGDLISREALKGVIETYRPALIYNNKTDMKNRMVDYFLDEIDNAQAIPLPSNQIAWEQGYEAGLAQGKQERKGEWIYHEKLNNYFCKDCGLLEPFTKEEIEEGIKLPNFCQQCGADMRKGGAE